MPTCTPATIVIPSEFIFPFHKSHTAFTPVDIPITGCGSFGAGLANLPQGPAHITVPIRTWGHPDENFNWIYDGWWLHDDIELRYESRDDSTLYGVTKYPNHGKIDANTWVSTGYYNPDAYWVPTAPGDPPPPGGDPTATPGQDPTTTEPPNHTVYVNRPYKYATLKTYNQIGVNRTGTDLAEDPNNPGVFFDPAPPGTPVLRLMYDDQAPLDSNLANADWEPDGENTRNQQVSLMAANKEGARGIRKIARNITSWKEIGVYSDWDSVDGQNVRDVSEDNVAGHASTIVERYQRPPNFMKLYMHLQPAAQTPARGDGETPALGWMPEPLRDFWIGDRVLARIRKGYMDTGDIVLRIMSVQIGQADANNTVTVEIDCVPHAGDLSEISVV